MAILFETGEKKESFILVGVSLTEGDDTENSLDELEELLATAGGETAGRLIQNREMIHPTTYLGKGKLEELRDMLRSCGADGIICDDELLPVQMRNMEDFLDTKVMDRTLLILDIFAGRAVTKEGKVQVELAQLRYRATRLIGSRDLSRLGGGIGTRGPGEKKLETDRRIIRERISHLKAEVADMASHREVTRAVRERRAVPVAAIVGYTNAGKSTLLNTLTKAEVLAEDKLFATLDPTTRGLNLPDGQEVILTDTVGFIRKLPHHLIDAFRSTLEEAKYADVLIHVVDCSNPQMDKQMYIVYETLAELEVTGKPVITFFNKIDRVDAVMTETGQTLQRPVLKDSRADYVVIGSVWTGEGLEELQKKIGQVIRDSLVYLKRTFSYEEAGKIGLIHKYGQIVKEQYLEDGIYVEAYVPADFYDK